MKKAIATIIALICIALTCVFSACEIAQGDTPENTGTATQTEPITEDMVEETVADVMDSIEETTTSPAPPNWTVYEDEALNAIINDLRAEGFDMEKTKFSEIHSSENYGYTADLNARVFRPGDTIEVNLSDLISYSAPVNAQEYYEQLMLNVFLAGHPGGSSWDHPFTTEDYTRYQFSIPADMKPGAYEIWLYLNDWGIMICPIVVYNDSAETQDWVTYEDDSLNATVNDLRAEGFDMEKTNFSEIHSSNNYGYTADLNARVFRLGDTIEVNLSDLMSYNQPVNAQELYEENTLYICIVEREDYYTPSTEFIMFTTENYTDYTFTLPQDMEPGVYEVMLELNGWGLVICPIVVYNGSAEIQDWVTYEDDSLNATVNDLRAEGFDMEKTNFSEIHSSNNYGYTADLNARVFRLGDTIEVNLSDLMSYNQPVNAQELYEENTLYICIVEREDYYTPSTEFIMFTTENYTDYTFTLPQDMEPGVYEVMLELNGWAIEICPIVVY